MPSPELLLRRLDELAATLAASGAGLALLALGSSGRERERLDRWSDLDFFAIVTPGAKAGLLQEPSWLSAPAQVEWLFRNTADGFKVLWADGVFGECAVFEPRELERIPYAPGRVAWSAPGFDPGVLEPRSRAGRASELPSEGWAREELLGGLYVGLARFRRGEKLSAFRVVQGHCLDRFLELVHRGGPEGGDAYDRLRRFEGRFPAAAPLLPALLGGYEATPAAARAFLGWLEATGPVNQGLRRRVLELLEGA
jgi:lincosamide nucleotidyltransferase B/F